jgi:hypothetical protein
MIFRFVSAVWIFIAISAISALSHAGLKTIIKQDGKSIKSASGITCHNDACPCGLIHDKPEDKTGTSSLQDTNAISQNIDMRMLGFTYYTNRTALSSSIKPASETNLVVECFLSITNKAKTDIEVFDTESLWLFRMVWLYSQPAFCVGKKTKTYHVKTNNKGEAKILNVKNLKVGTYKVTVTTPDERFKIKEKGHILIYGKAKKKTTIKMKKNKYGIEATKKLNKRDILWTFYEPRDAQFKKGVYAKTYDVKNPLDGFPHSMIYKTKFYFKNKKTGKIISKTAKLKADKFYGWKDIKVKPIKGYKPIETKVWYLTR